MQCKVVSGDDSRVFYIKIIKFNCNHQSALNTVKSNQIQDINLFDKTLIQKNNDRFLNLHSLKIYKYVNVLDSRYGIQLIKSFSMEGEKSKISGPALKRLKKEFQSFATEPPDGLELSEETLKGEDLGVWQVIYTIFYSIVDDLYF